MKRFLVILTFFTRIPIPIKFDVEYEDYVKGTAYMPLVGLIIGLPLYFLGLLNEYIQPFVLSFILLLAYLFISGGLHIDGLADTMDALGSNRKKQRMLEILRDTNMGTFGVLSVIIYCIGMVVILPFVPRVSLLLFPFVGRICAVTCAKTHNYARETGLGKSFVEGAKTWHIIFYSIVFVLVAFAVLGIDNYVGAAAVVLSAILSVFITWLYVHGISKKIDGITGDIIGYSVEVSQVFYLFITYILVVLLKLGGM